MTAAVFAMTAPMAPATAIVVIVVIAPLGGGCRRCRNHLSGAALDDLVEFAPI